MNSVLLPFLNKKINLLLKDTAFEWEFFEISIFALKFYV